MAKDTLSLILEAAAAKTGPAFVASAKNQLSTIDPCGLREVNFGMMNELCDGMNNVARHTRPLVFLAWSWRRALKLAEAGGVTLANSAPLERFVLRAETIFAWSILLADRNEDIPGRDAMSPILKQAEYRFGGTHWEGFSKLRRVSTGFSAPANYGPGLRSYGWLRRNVHDDQALVPTVEAMPALDAFEATFSDLLSHPAFNTFDEVTVTAAEAERFSHSWKLAALTEEERAHMREALVGSIATPTRRDGVGYLLHAARHMSLVDPSTEEAALEVRRAVGGDVPGFITPEGFESAAANWRRLQVRQLFRYSVEALLAWTLDRLGKRPVDSDDLVAAFLSEARIDPSASAQDGWLGVPDRAASLSDATAAIRTAIREPGRSGLARAVASGIAISLANAPPTAEDYEPDERLPLANAGRQARARAHLPVPELARHVLETWVIAQHVFWAVGRGIQDARGGGKPIHRLQVAMEEGGWQAMATARLQPEPTRDRIRTALTLAREAGLLPAA